MRHMGRIALGFFALILMALTQNPLAAAADVATTFAKEVHTNVYHRVVLEDVLGEGGGAWDADPRYPVGTVNCMVWLQLLLAETYSKDKPELKSQIMDRIRYYGGVASFGTRKHFVDHWLMLDPTPLKPIDIRACLGPSRAQPAHHHVHLDFRRFAAAQSYRCPLYQEDRAEHSFDFVRLKDFQSCAKALPAGHYVLFAVPSTKFLNRTIKKSGPMGLVHSIVLEVPSPLTAMSTGASSQRPLVFHASTAGKHVKIEPLDIFLKNSGTIHQGYVVYTLDPTWSPTSESLAQDRNATTANAAAKVSEILSCEKALPRR